MTITLRNFTAGQTFGENLVNTTPQFIDTDVTLAATQSLAGGRLVLNVANLNGRFDRFLIAHEGDGAGQVGVINTSGSLEGTNTFGFRSDVTYGGVVIGTNQANPNFYIDNTFNIIMNGTNIDIRFNANVTVEAVEALIERITFSNFSNTPTPVHDFTIDVLDSSFRGLLGQTALLTPISEVPFTMPEINNRTAGTNAAPAFADLDADGDLDMIVGTQGAGFQYWRNTGGFSYQIPMYTQVTGTDNPFNGIGGAFQRTPTFVDLDGDGDKDLVAGSGSGKIWAWQNTGTASAPAFTQLTGTANPFNNIPFGYVDDVTTPLYRSAPVFVDLDGDGDQDLVVGEQYGRLLAWRNTGTVNAPAFTALTGAANPFDGIDVGYFSAPTFADMDGDGDFDLIVGSGTGAMPYYENTGTASVAAFTLRPQQGRNATTTNSKPVLVDLNGDERPDLVSAASEGRLIFWKNNSPPPTFTIRVTSENDVPVISSPDPVAGRAEGPSLVAVTGVATDPEGTPTTFTWSLAGADAGQFNINSATGVVTFKVAPNFEAPTDANGDNAYEFVIQASDGIGIGERAVTLNIVDVNEAPVVTSGATASFAENGTGVVYTGTKVDQDQGALTTWSLAGADAALFNINAASGAVTFKLAPDYEKPKDAGADNVYNITVRIFDGEFTASKDVAISVTNVNEAPRILAGRVNFAENSTATAYVGAAIDPDAGTTLTWSLSGADAGKFNIDTATGDVTFKTAPDHEAPTDVGLDNVYDLTLTVTDGTLSDTEALKIAVQDLSDLMVTGLPPTRSYGENTVNATPQFLYSGIEFKADESLTGAVLTLSGLLTEDRVSIVSQGNAAGQIGVSGGTVSYGGVAFGTASGGNGDTLTVTFNANATAVAVDALLERIAYANVSDTPTATRGLVLDIAATGGDVLGSQPGQFSFDPYASARIFVDMQKANYAYGAPLIPFSVQPGAAILDVNGDGLLDMVVNVRTSTYFNATQDSLRTYLNVGTATAPRFDQIMSDAQDPFNYQFLGEGVESGTFQGFRINVTPVVADLDQDGDLDVVAGSWIGGLYAWRNTGTAAAPAFTPMLGAENPFADSGRGLELSLAFGSQTQNWKPGDVAPYAYRDAYPAFADLTGDGLVDLVVGARITSWGTQGAANTSVLSVWRNTGTKDAPVFSEQLLGADNPLNGIDISPNGGGGTPTFVDLDGDGDLDLVVGNDYGTLRVWRNTGSSTEPVFTELTGTANPFAGVQTAGVTKPSFADLNGDGALDLIVGSMNIQGTTWPGSAGFDVSKVSFRLYEGAASAKAATTTVTVTAQDDVPRFTSGGTASLAENATGTVYTAAAFDPDGDIFVLSSITGADAGLFDFDTGTGQVSFKTAPDFETKADANADGVYEITINATSYSWTGTNYVLGPVGSRAVSITVTNVNEAPVITSGAAVNYGENGLTVAYAAAATDPDAGTTLAWTISGTDAGKFNINATTGALTFKASPDFEAPGDSNGDNVYEFVVTTSDGALSDSKSVSITVTDRNDAPVVTSGGSANFAENAVGTVYAATATDQDGNSISWTLGGADAALFDIDATTGLVAFKASPDRETPLDAGADNVYNINVIAADGTTTTSQAVAVTVTNVNEAPAITSGGTASFAENSSGDAYTAAGSDVDVGTTLTWSLSGTDAALFNINATSGAVTFKTAPNFEAAADDGGNNVYDIIVTASDGALSDSKAVAITVTDVNDAPVVTSGGSANFAENAVGTVYAATATDQDGNSISWTLGGADAALFDIDATTGLVAFKASPDRETPLDAGADNVYNINVIAADGTTTTSQAVAITVTNVNETPAITSAGTASFAENSTVIAYAAAASDVDAGTTLTWSLSGTDAALFNINAASGAVTFKTAPNFEAAADDGGNNIYDIIVTASDGALSDSKAVAITVTNVNEAPVVISGRTVSVAENVVIPVYTAQATDPDGDTVTWSLSGVDAARFAINAATGVLRFLTSPDYEAPVDQGANNVYDLVVVGSDGSLTGSRAVTITVLNAIEGAAAADTITGTAGADIIQGFAGSDSLNGGAGADTLDGGTGNDTLNGGIGADILIGGVNDDTYIVDSAGDVVIEGVGEGYDRVIASVSYILAANVEQLGLSGTQNLNGTGNALDNRIDGNAGANILDGGEGNDSLFGLAGNDRLIGGQGNDRLEGGLGADTMEGGTGDDTYYLDDLGDVVIEGTGGGSDRVFTSVSFTLGAELEWLSLSGTADLNGTGNTLANRVDGNAGANIVDGGDGNDSLYGLAGNDRLIGGQGADYLDGGQGADSMAGGADDDTYIVDDLGDVVIEAAGGGTDRVSTSISYTLGAELERLSLLGTADLSGTGNALGNRIEGNAGANILDGGDGNDSLYGFAGNDRLIGGQGADYLDGGQGADSMTGGLGADRFDFRSATEAQGDVIDDFSEVQGDIITLLAIDANPWLAGDQAFAWIGGASFGKVAGQLRFAGGLLEGDVDGNGVADFQIGLSGVASLTAANIWL